MAEALHRLIDDGETAFRLPRSHIDTVPLPNLIKVKQTGGSRETHGAEAAETKQRGLALKQNQWQCEDQTSHDQGKRGRILACL